jgi:hypothetical protein
VNEGIVGPGGIAAGGGVVGEDIVADASARATSCARRSAINKTLLRARNEARNIVAASSAVGVPALAMSAADGIA